MYKRFGLLFVLLAAFSAPVVISPVAASTNLFRDPQDQKRVLNVPHRRRRRGRDTRRHRGIGHAYKHGGKSAGRGGKRFGKNIAHGKPVKGGKELGKGMGGFGKGVGKGTGRSGRKAGRKIKHAVTP